MAGAGSAAEAMTGAAVEGAAGAGTSARGTAGAGGWKPAEPVESNHANAGDVVVSKGMAGAAAGSAGAAAGSAGAAASSAAAAAGSAGAATGSASHQRIFTTHCGLGACCLFLMLFVFCF